LSKQDFAIAVFGKANHSSEIIENYFKDWKNSGYSLELYVSLLKTRG
jgi:hypothetical protein